MQIFLSQEERKCLINSHKRERDKRVCDRIKAVLLFDEGWSIKQISHCLLITDDTIRQHVRDYQTSQKLKPENGRSLSKLNIYQTQQLLEHLEKHTYLYTKDIAAYVKETFKVDFTVSRMNGWLKAHDFSYKKPAIVPGKVNYEVQKQ
ncbi:winged helix-turn-helix domain-containing protein [Chlamydiales bacterium]|nr:winged helix-turn-helix domain-containing protein [Chlamydiales bacterium]